MCQPLARPPLSRFGGLVLNGRRPGIPISIYDSRNRRLQKVFTDNASPPPHQMGPQFSGSDAGPVWSDWLVPQEECTLDVNQTQPPVVILLAAAENVPGIAG
jgi:hypothetical protein